MPRALALLFAAALPACQSTNQQTVPPLREVFPIYAKQSDAHAIGAGNFGATPIALPTADQIVMPVLIDCKSDVSEVELSNGVRGWIPTDALPIEMKAKLGCA